MVELTKQLCKGIEVPFLDMDELMKYLSEGGMQWRGVVRLCKK